MWLTRRAGLRDVVRDTQRMREAIISIPATCLAARFQTPPFDLTLFFPLSVLLGLPGKMLIKYRPRRRQSDKKVCSGETSRLQGEQPLDLLLGSRCRPGGWEGFISLPFSPSLSPPKPSSADGSCVFHLLQGFRAGSVELMVSQLLMDISFLPWLRGIEGSPAMPIHSPGRGSLLCLSPFSFLFRKHICYSEILAFTQQRF